MKISVIYAQNEDGAIGLAGPHPLPWHHPEDLKRFKELTAGKPVIMGMNTFDSLPRMLPGRYHYVLTGRRGLHRLGPMAQLQFVANLFEVVALEEGRHDEVFIIGGGDLIEKSLPYATHVYRTVVRNHPLKGKVVVVREPGDYPYWGQFQKTREYNPTPELIFQDYTRL